MNQKRILITITLFIVLSGSILYFFDAPLRSVSNNLHILKSHKSHHESYPSPDYFKNDELLNYHWQLSPIYSLLEDVFYPVRQWESHPKQMVTNINTKQRAQQQLDGVIKNRNAAEVRAKRAYFLAKRRNFKRDDLNQDYLNKKRQWKSLYQSVIEQKLNIKYMNYNTIGFLIGLLLVITLIFKRLGVSWINTCKCGLVLLVALLLSSFQPIILAGIPLHWFIALYMVFASHVPKKISGNLAVSIGTISIFCAFLTSALGASIGCALIYFLRRNIQGQLVHFLSFIHPLGSGLVQQRSIRIKIAGLSFSAIVFFVAQLLNHELLFSMPFPYLSNAVTVILGIILMVIGGAYIHRSDGDEPKKNWLIICLVAILMIASSEFLFYSVLHLTAAFIVHPIIYWGGIIIMLYRASAESADQKFVK